MEWHELSRSKRILVVDDNQEIHNDFARILCPELPSADLGGAAADFLGETLPYARGATYELTHAFQGEEADRLVRDACASGKPFPLAFVDMRMPPGWDGLTTVEHLWEADPFLQVVICTAYSDYSWEEICERLGDRHNLLLLKKPFDAAEVRQLALALTKKYALEHRVRMKLDDLETVVEQRTRELREKDEQLQHRQRLESIGSLAGGVAHEFNNLLQVILGYTQFVMDELPPEDPKHEDLRQVADAGQKAAQITQQLLDFSRFQPIQPVLVDLNRAVRSACRMLRPLMGETIDLNVSLVSQPALIRGSEGAISQILTNLCLNARDAMPGGGTIHISTDVRPSRDRDSDGSDLHNDTGGEFRVHLRVHDTGHGIHPDIRKRIFDPFFTTKEVGKGTGMGLAVVYSLVQQCEGEIRVASTPGAGTTFDLVFRGHKGCVSDEPEKVETPVVRGTGTVLVVEDEPIVQLAVRRILANAGYSVLLSGDGEEALETLRRDSSHIDLVISDVVMPRMDGRELCRTVQQQWPDLPVLLCTGYDPNEQLSDDLAGIPVLRKPVQRSSLLTAVSEAMHGGARTCQSA